MHLMPDLSPVQASQSASSGSALPPCHVCRPQHLFLTEWLDLQDPGRARDIGTSG